MLYTTLIAKIDKFIQNNPDDPGSQTVTALAKETNRSVHDYLYSVDIHDIDTLRRIIPNAFPVALRTGGLMGSINRDHAWTIKPYNPVAYMHGKEFKGVIL